MVEIVISVDDKLNLSLGFPVKINEHLSVVQHRIGDVAKIGFEHYLDKISFLLREVDEFMKMLVESPNYMDLYLRKNELTEYELQVMFCVNEDYQQIFKECLCLVLGLDTDDISVGGDGIYYTLPDTKYEFGNGIDELSKRITEQEFAKILEIVKVSNGFKQIESAEDENPYDDKARHMLDKLRRNREKVDQIKAKETGDSGKRDIADIISAVTVMSNSANKLNIKDYTLYQLYDENTRLYAIENYRLAVKASMFGGDGEITDWGAPNN